MKKIVTITSILILISISTVLIYTYAIKNTKIQPVDLNSIIYNDAKSNYFDIKDELSSIKISSIVAKLYEYTESDRKSYFFKCGGNCYFQEVSPLITNTEYNGFSKHMVIEYGKFSDSNEKISISKYIFFNVAPRDKGYEKNAQYVLGLNYDDFNKIGDAQFNLIYENLENLMEKSIECTYEQRPMAEFIVSVSPPSDLRYRERAFCFENAFTVITSFPKKTSYPVEEKQVNIIDFDIDIDAVSRIVESDIRFIRGLPYPEEPFCRKSVSIYDAKTDKSGFFNYSNCNGENILHSSYGIEGNPNRILNLLENDF